MNKTQQKAKHAKRHHRVSSFSLADQPLFFWVDLMLIFVSMVVLALNFFQIGWLSFDISLLIVVSIFGLLPVIYNAFKALFKFRLTIDLLASIALVFSLLAREWQSAVFISLMLASARIFVRYTQTRAKNAIASLMKLRPEHAHLLRDGKLIEVDVRNLVIGDLIVVESGERLSADGVVYSGEASVDQSSLTGESEPIAKAAGDEVLHSTLNVSGSLVVKVTRAGEDTTFSKILELVQQSQQSKSIVASLADRFSTWYIILTLAGSAIIYFYTSSLSLVLSVLLVTCADDLAVAVPLAFTAAVGFLARRGVIIKGGEYLEVLAKVKAMVFDKTGTITLGKPQVAEIKTFNNFSENEFLALLGAVEYESEHPMARATQKLVETRKINIPKINKVHEEPGFGIKGVINGQEIIAGKTKFLKDNGVVLSTEELASIEAQKTAHRTITILSQNGKAIGFIAMQDAIRPASTGVMARLKSLGVGRLIMLTGDNEKIAAEVTGGVGISEFHANLLPQDKIDYLKKILAQGGKVAMVGDGVNDAAVLSLADVGIAMGAIGTDAAIESADIVLMKDNIQNIPEIINLSRQTMSVVRQDLWLWGALNLFGLILVFAGVLNPAGAAAYNFVTDFLPLTNSLRIFSFKFKTKAIPAQAADEVESPAIV